MTDHREEIERIIQTWMTDLFPDLEMPVLLDWVVVFAVDDAADPREGGHYLGYPRNTHSYRVKGLLTHALDLVGVDVP